MFGASSDSRRWIRSTCAFGIPFLCAGALTAEASAATLTVNMPARVRLNKGYTVRITGSFKHRELRGEAYLIPLIQYSSRPCEATAQLEHGLPTSVTLQFYLLTRSGAGTFERHSPFTLRDSFTAKVLGSRHLCAYLYPKQVDPTSKVLPIATADKKFTVIKK